MVLGRAQERNQLESRGREGQQTLAEDINKSRTGSQQTFWEMDGLHP
jgi:hypothetical protein